MITRLKREIEKKIQRKWIMDQTMKNGKISSVSFFENNPSNVWFMVSPTNFVELLVKISNAWWRILINSSHMQFWSSLVDDDSEQIFFFRFFFFFHFSFYVEFTTRPSSDTRMIMFCCCFLFRYIKWLYIKIENT